MAKSYLRKAGVRQRYGDISKSTVERMLRDGRLPPPQFFGDSPTPFWDVAALDEHDRRATTRPNKPTKRDEVLSA
jgi:hypothetical protein